jgi:hypothetical protein
MSVRMRAYRAFHECKFIFAFITQGITFAKGETLCIHHEGYDDDEGNFFANFAFFAVKWSSLDLDLGESACYVAPKKFGFGREIRDES